jgi:hypothetical protein
MNSAAPPERPSIAVGPRRRTWLYVVLWLIIFGSGTVVGAGSTLWVVRNRVLDGIQHPERAPAGLARHLQRMLDLDDAQRDQVEHIFERRQKELQKVRRSFQPEVEAQLDQVEQDVSAVLNDVQRAEWQTRFRELRARWLPALPPALSGPEEPTR